jgi:hypothetical protein
MTRNVAIWTWDEPERLLGFACAFAVGFRVCAGVCFGLVFFRLASASDRLRVWYILG